MATAQAMRKWRDRNRFVKRQLNVMAGKLVHDLLDEVASDYDLRGKAEAIAYACFVTRALQQQADFNDEAARLLDLFRANWAANREFYV